jgi:hypothetical protein
MITVAGEALIDLIVDPAGHVDARFGGGPFNVARAIARLGQPAVFLGRLSGDRFGRPSRPPPRPPPRWRSSTSIRPASLATGST